MKQLANTYHCCMPLCVIVPGSRSVWLVFVSPTPAAVCPACISSTSQPSAQPHGRLERPTCKQQHKQQQPGQHCRQRSASRVTASSSKSSSCGGRCCRGLENAWGDWPCLGPAYEGMSGTLCACWVSSPRPSSFCWIAVSCSHGVCIIPLYWVGVVHTYSSISQPPVMCAQNAQVQPFPALCTQPSILVHCLVYMCAGRPVSGI